MDEHHDDGADECVAQGDGSTDGSDAGDTGETLTDGMFDATEMAIIGELTPLPAAPADPTNEYADLSEAVVLGRALYWDKTMDGGINTGTDCDRNVLGDACDDLASIADNAYVDALGIPHDAQVPFDKTTGGTPLAWGKMGEWQESGCQGCHNGQAGADNRESAHWPLSIGKRWHTRTTPHIVNTVGL